MATYFLYIYIFKTMVVLNFNQLKHAINNTISIWMPQKGIKNQLSKYLLRLNIDNN